MALSSLFRKFGGFFTEIRCLTGVKKILPAHAWKDLWNHIKLRPVIPFMNDRLRHFGPASSVNRI